MSLPLTPHRPHRHRAVPSTLAAVVLAGLAAACSPSADDIAEEMRGPVGDHTGNWTEDQLRAAAGKFGDDIAGVDLATDGSGGTVYFETGGHDDGDRKGSTKVGDKRRTTYYDDYEVECVAITVDGTDLTERSFDLSDDDPVSCTDG
ncbi:hypothetical protein [Nocardioides sp.]|uniref:hypothetical protein n=1 Tax=Nocardioides sp. TaxID=35761 RepID=UPI003511055A